MPKSAENITEKDSTYTIEAFHQHLIGLDDLDLISRKQLLQLPIDEAVKTLQDLLDAESLETQLRAQRMLLRLSRITSQ